MTNKSQRNYRLVATRVQKTDPTGLTEKSFHIDSSARTSKGTTTIAGIRIKLRLPTWTVTGHMPWLLTSIADGIWTNIRIRRWVDWIHLIL